MDHFNSKYLAVFLLALSLLGCAGPIQRGATEAELDAVRSRADSATRAIDAEKRSGANEAR